ncbi:MAG: universal stress protein [Actinomycetota bacterium]|nr:universal stress protein [Actinomycetota bacterium]
MSQLDVVTEFGPNAATSSVERPEPLEVVVGFDGSRCSLRALTTARQLADDHAGRVHVVYVAHVPAAAALSAQAIVGIRDGFDAIARELAEAASAVLGASGRRWTFQRRDGSIAHELLAAAEELDQSRGHARTVIVVGSAEHAYHRIGGSVPGHLAHQNRFALTVAPTGASHAKPVPPG